MDCPQCIHKITYVIDSREYDNGDAIKRRRECENVNLGLILSNE